MKKVIVYSALHTGTWFTCDILTDATKEHTDYRADMWVNRGSKIATGKHPENPETNSVIEKALQSGKTREFDALLDLQRSRGLEVPDYIEAFILQAHNRTESQFYNYIRDFKPEVPVIIPFRDPLLSINTRAWRECGSMKVLLEEHIDNRTLRVRDQLASIIRLLTIPDSHAYKFAIDIKRTDENKIKIFNDIIEFASLAADNEQVIEKAKRWEPVNPTVGWAFAQQDTNNIEMEEFVSTKNAILSGDIEFIKQYMDIEIELTRSMLAHFKPELEALGYRNLCWW